MGGSFRELRGRWSDRGPFVPPSRPWVGVDYLDMNVTVHWWSGVPWWGWLLCAVGALFGGFAVFTWYIAPAFGL